MQSEVAAKLCRQYQIDNIESDTMVLIKDHQAYIRTDAALEIAKALDGYWYLFRVFKILPGPFRDWFYRMFAKNRYKLFGRSDHCMVPTQAVRRRFCVELGG